MRYEFVPLSRIRKNPNDARTDRTLDMIDTMGRSLKLHGQMVPCIVDAIEGTDEVQTVDGMTRVLGAEHHGISGLWCIIREHGDPDWNTPNVKSQATINTHRTNLTDIDQAIIAVKNAMAMSKAHGIDLDEAIQLALKDVDVVTRSKVRKLVYGLAPEVWLSIGTGPNMIRAKVARELTRLSHAEQWELMPRVIDERLSAEKVAEIVAEMKGEKPKPKKGGKKNSIHINDNDILLRATTFDHFKAIGGGVHYVPTGASVYVVRSQAHNGQDVALMFEDLMKNGEDDETTITVPGCTFIAKGKSASSLETLRQAFELAWAKVDRMIKIYKDREKRNGGGR